MRTTNALVSGLAGACALTLLHESARRVLPDAPRVDLLGMRAIARLMREGGQEPPERETLFGLALAGDLLSNALYYSLVGAGRPEGAPARGALLGFAAGALAVALPGPLGLGSGASARTPATALMTAAWYTAGGLVAGAVCRRLTSGPGAARTPR